MTATTYNKNKKKITWVTPDYFIDCDFNPEILSHILMQFDIYWLILLPSKDARFTEKHFETLSGLQGLKIEFVYWTVKARSPKMLLFYEQIYRKIKASRPDLIYFNYAPESPYVLPLYWRLKKSKTIVTAHDGNVKPSFKMAWLSKFVFRFAFNTVRYVNTFSVTQARIFSSLFNRAKVFIIPLALKDFGATSISKRTDNIIFLFFGAIHSNKNVELLIEAACNLYDKGVRGFRVSIHGYCTEWEKYSAGIKYPQLFECDIRVHRNEEIPDLLGQSHYMVFPYKDMSQSGALKVAFHYQLPVIVSDLQGFKDEVEDGVNGFIFESGNVQQLEGIMLDRINYYAGEYELLQQRIKEFNNEHYAAEVLRKKYIDMFNEVLSNTI